MTAVYVTHDQAEAMSLADRIAVMRNGRICQIGTPEEIYEKPNNLFVAGFIGSPSMNFFDATIIEKDGKIFLDVGEFKVNITDLKDLV